MRSALDCCLSMRTASVFTPLKSSQESKGDRPQPEALMVKYRRSPRALSLTAMTPAIKSWWPLRYFVPDS